jgi:hypothetical protein
MLLFALKYFLTISPLAGDPCQFKLSAFFGSRGERVFGLKRGAGEV